MKVVLYKIPPEHLEAAGRIAARFISEHQDKRDIKNFHDGVVLYEAGDLVCGAWWTPSGNVTVYRAEQHPAQERS